MCGICGYIGKGDPDTLDAMSVALTHRGPDDQGNHFTRGLGLAHRRLSVIDLTTGHQPMVSPEGNVLVFNGEIYNFQEIRTELENHGHVFKTHSDTEVILHSYRQWGEECLHRFRGMFAFALWDAREKHLFIARDRVGIKPLYYAELNGTFYFASEAKALLEIPGFERRLNRRILPLYLTFRYTPGEETLFAGIRKLMPGHCMTVKPGGHRRIRRYWELVFEPDEGPSEEAWKERFWMTFDESVRLRMISDVPFGAYLSGGLDSSLIVAAMSEHSSSPIDTFTVGFKAKRFNELPYAKEVAGRFGCRQHILHAEEEAVDLLDHVIYHLDEPLGDLATIPTYLMARETKPHVTVVLSGEGADELLAGYPKYRAILAGHCFSRVLPGEFFSAASRLSSNISLKRAFASMAVKDRPRSYLELTSVFSAMERESLLNPLARNGVMPDSEVEAFLRPFFCPGLDGLSQLLSLDFHTWLSDDLLLKNDRMTMAHGVEARVPYLDHELVELCARIPSKYKLRWAQEKVLLRKVMAGKLPKKIRRRRKTGFTVPLGQWHNGPFGRQVDEVFSEDFIRSKGLFSGEYLAELQKKPLNHQYYRRQFWTLAALGLWQKRFKIEVD